MSDETTEAKMSAAETTEEVQAAIVPDATASSTNDSAATATEAATAATPSTDLTTDSDASSAPVIGSDVAAPVAAAEAAPVEVPAEAVAADDDQMPPLDQIEVPGEGGRGGGGRGGDRGGRNDRNGGGGRGDRGGDRNNDRGGFGGDRDNDRGGYSSSGREFQSGQVVTGTVVHIDNDGVLVDVGAKSEGLIRPNELSREPIQNVDDVVKVGDKIEVVVLEEGRDGSIFLSKKRADFEKAWDKVQEALGDGRTLQAIVSDRVKGGLVVDLGIRGFVPASHVGNGKLKNLDKFVGQTVPLKVLEVDREHRKVVLSHRLATEEERQQQKEATIGSLSEGQTRTGTIRRVTDYGAFVDLGGIDGLLHVSEMSWTRIKHPSDVVKVGDSVDVMILKLNLEQGRVSLGMRQIMPDPWEQVAEKYHVNDTVEGEVTRLVPFGAFVLLEGGIEGIIPNSELAHRRIAKPSDVLEVGQMVQVKVIDVRADERRLTLSLRALQPREAGDDQRRPTDTEAGAPGTTEEARERRPRRGGRRDEEDASGGGDFRQYVAPAGGGGFGGGFGGITLGDMFGDMLGGRGGAATGKKKGGRRRDEEEEDDLSDLDNMDATADDVDIDTDESADAGEVTRIESAPAPVATIADMMNADKDENAD